MGTQDRQKLSTPDFEELKPVTRTSGSALELWRANSVIVSMQAEFRSCKSWKAGGTSVKTQAWKMFAVKLPEDSTDPEEKSWLPKTSIRFLGIDTVILDIKVTFLPWFLLGEGILKLLRKVSSVAWHKQCSGGNAFAEALNQKVMEKSKYTNPTSLCRFQSWLNRNCFKD